MGPGILGILIVNISGSFLLGIISAIILEQDQWPAEVKLFTSVGILGSYTTFSTLMLTSTQLANNGDLWKALLNISASLIFGILATIFGIFLGNFISPIVMAIIFFFVVTPIGILMKVLKKDLINLKKNNDKSYWIIKEDIKSKMTNQF